MEPRRNLCSGRVGVLCERNEFSVSVAWTQRSQDDVETSRAKSLCGDEGGIVPSTSAMFGMPNMDGRACGKDGFDGDNTQYERLLANDGITEEADVRWQEICEYERYEIPEDQVRGGRTRSALRVA